MNDREIFISHISASGKFAGAFEYDGETSYFYLYTVNEKRPVSILAALHIYSGHPSFSEDDLRISWDILDKKVGLFIKNELWAVFDCEKKSKEGGNYNTFSKPVVPADLSAEWHH